MLAALVKVLLSFSTLLGVPSFPRDTAGWTIVHDWQVLPSGVLESEFSRDLSTLNCTGDAALYFPMLIHGAHEIFVDGKLILTFNNPTMKSVRSFYGKPSVACNLLSGHTLTWKLYSNTRYFARLHAWPQVIATTYASNLLEESANIAAFGALFFLALYLLTGMGQKVLTELHVSLAALALGLSIYLAMTTPGLLGFRMTMLFAHRVADFCLISATAAFIKYLNNQYLVPYWLSRCHYIAVAIGLFIVAIGNSGDQIQVGTTITLSVMLICVFTATANCVYLVIFPSTHRFVSQSLFDFAGLTFFSCAAVNDFLCVLGVGSNNMILPLGVVGGCYSFATALHSGTAKIFIERDHLRKNLQAEVIAKTSEIEQKRAELQDNFSKLQTAQAELVQSAKLASLGTLAAGIAHEINNSINYVSGSLPALENLIKKNIPDDANRVKIDELVRIMKDGVNWTVTIVKSLRLYTGLNQSQFKEAKIAELVNAVIAIVGSRLRNKIDVVIDIPPQLSLFGHIVGLNQVLMNLITNALDAMDNKGTLTIHAKESGDRVLLSVKDTGSGMDEKTKAKIFEPFFTTKEVGKGTGLGLHIVKKEVDQHQGRLTFESDIGRGTTFYIDLPKQVQMPQQREVA